MKRTETRPRGRYGFGGAAGRAERQFRKAQLLQHRGVTVVITDSTEEKIKVPPGERGRYGYTT